ncbi:MAG: hypothetical protein GXO87_07515, partial [Chlorobi bacterium]|nr:hypothetical protein [Chlorobiota bacterium]
MKNGNNNNSIFAKTKLRFLSFFIAIFFSLNFGGFSALAQSPDWNSFLTISTFPSPYFSQWERDPSIGNLTLNYSGTPAAEFYFSVEITNPNYGTVVSGTTDSFNFEFGPTMRVFTFQDVVDWGSVSVNSQVDRLIKQTGMFPEGEYEVCIQTLAPSGNMLTESCASFEIIQPDPPQLISPADEEVLSTVQPTFLWNQVIVPPVITDIYLLTIVEVLDGQTKFRAMQSNIPVLEEKLTRINTYTYSLNAYPLEMNKTYAWRVTAIDEEGTPIAKNAGKSDIWQFSLGSGSGELNFDKLTLIKDTAYLIDLENLNVTDDGSSIILDGQATIELVFGDGSVSAAPINVNSLKLQKDTFESPVFLGGNVTGKELSGNVLPKKIIGDYFVPTALEFDYTGVLKFTGGFVYQGNSPIPFAGELTLDVFGLNGDLEIFSTPGEAIFKFGDETAGVGITGITLNFPSTELRLYGNAFLFNQLSDCEIGEIIIEKDGEINFDFDCDISTQFPLIPGSDLFTLGINSIGGKLTANLLSAGKETYDIDVEGKMTFNFNPGNLFGADVAFNVAPGKFNLTSFKPFGNYETSNIDLGWVNFLIEDLQLKNLSYANGAWDYEMTMGANFFFPDFFETPLPRVKGVSFTPQGFSFPSFDLSGKGIPTVDFEGFGLTIDKVTSKPFDFNLASWTPGSIADMNFEFDVLFNMPNFPAGSDNRFSNLDLNLSAQFDSGNFSLTIPEFTFDSPGASFPLGGGIDFHVLNLSGKLNTEYDGSVMNFLPDINLKGKIDMPEAFACEGNATADITTSMKVAGNGMITGTAYNIIPSCPLDLGFVKLTVKESVLEFKNENGQKVYLDGTGLLSFTSPDGNPINAKLRVRYEIIEGKLIFLEGVIDEPFILTLLPDYPALRFEINGAEIKNNLLTIDGRHKILFDDGAFLGATFDKFALSLEDLSIKTGGVIFDSPFAFMITGIEDFDLTYKAVPIGTPIKKDVSAIYLELPDEFGIDGRGLFAKGDAKAKMAYQGQEFEDLDLKFIDNFAMYFSSPLRVVQGQCDIYYDKTKIAYINRDGFFPDPSYFINEAIPARLPLPTEDIAYLQIKDEATNDFIINIQESGTTLVYSTFDGQPVPLVLPSLQQGKPAPPQLPTEFNLTVSKTTGLIKDGYVSVTVPEALQSDFDLSDRGIPFEIHSIYYGKIGGVYAFRFTGVPKLFGEDAVCSDSTVLTLYSDGRLEGNLNCDLNMEFPLVEGSDKLTLFVNNFNGEFLTNLLTPKIDFDFEIDANLKLKLSEGHDYNPWILLGFTPDGVEIRDYDLDTLGVGIIPISPSLEIGISNLSVPTLDWDSTPGSGWNFELGMDVLVRFPEFDNLTIPNLNGITLDNDGFHFPNISLPDLSGFGGGSGGADDGDGLRFEFGGLGLKPLAFRMPAFDMDWFSPDGGNGDWDFGFDFEIDFPNLEGDASDGMRFPEITMLD